MDRVSFCDLCNEPGAAVSKPDPERGVHNMGLVLCDHCRAFRNQEYDDTVSDELTVKISRYEFNFMLHLCLAAFTKIKLTDSDFEEFIRKKKQIEERIKADVESRIKG